MKINKTIKNASSKDLFRLLYAWTEAADRVKVITTTKADYPDGIARTMTYRHELRGGLMGDGRIVYHDHYQLSQYPARDDITAEAILNYGTENFAVIFTGYQIRDDVLLEVKYSEAWQDFINGMLAELQTLYPEPAPTAPAAVNKGKAKPKTGKKITLPTSKAALRKWALLWEFNVKHYEIKKFNAKQFRIEFELYDKFDKPYWIPQDEETLQAILDYGRAGKIPKHDSIE